MTTKRIVFAAALLMILVPLAAPASELSDAASSMAPGEWREIETGGFGIALLDACNGVNTILEYANKGTWNRIHREVHFVGQGHYSCAKHIVYRESSNSWTTTALPAGISELGHGYEHNTINPEIGEIFYRHYNSTRIERFNHASGSWTSLPSIPTSVQVAGAIEYFPERNGILYVDGDFGVYFYNTDSGSWSHLADGSEATNSRKPQLSMGPIHNFASYNASEKVIYFGGGDGSQDVYKFDSSGSISQVSSSPVAIAVDAAMTMEDPASGTQLVFANNGDMFSYDSDEDNWISEGTHPVSSENRIGIPISTHGVIMFLEWRFENSTVLLYKHAPGAQTPSEVRQPSPPSDLVAN